MSDGYEYRDSADERDVLDEEREGTADTRSDATGDAREDVGNTARGAAGDATGSEGNDRTRQRPRPDAVDAELERDHRGG